jgi:hypothetical protein
MARSPEIVDSEKSKCLAHETENAEGYHADDEIELPGDTFWL